MIDTHSRSVIRMDPRRVGRAMLAVWCWCGRFYTLTPEQMKRAAAEGQACPAKCEPAPA